MHKAHVSWLISASIIGSTLEDVPYPEWCQFLKHLASLMHLHGETISEKEKNLFARQGWEMDEGQTLS